MGTFFDYMNTKTLVEFKNVEVKAGEHTLLRNVSFKLGQQELISLIGLNGAGKSTLLKTILGVYSPSAGTIKVKAKRIGYVPQRLDFDRSIPITVVEFLSTFSDSSKEMIRKKLAEVNAKNLIEKKMGVLSGGEMQRVLIANALLRKPDLLLLDEATAGIDVAGEHAFYELVEKLHKNYEIAVVMVSHDIHTVFAKASRVLCLNQHLCCEGTPEDVSKNPEFNELFCDHLAPYSHKHDHSHH